jgi:hypothetical protein
MPASNGIFEEQYIYTEGNGNINLGFNVYLTDVYGKYVITPIRNNGGSGFYYTVESLYSFLHEDIVTFRSKKKAMQYVVAELFTELFDYEQYGFTKHTRIYI